MKKGKTSMVFESKEQMDEQLRHMTEGSYTRDKKNPLKIYLNF